MGNLSAGAFLVAASGLFIVFIMLAVLSAIILVVSRVVSRLDALRQKGKPAEKKPENVPGAPAAAAAAPAAVAGEVALVGVDEKTAACIMAIVSHETGIPLSELVFHKIKAL